MFNVTEMSYSTVMESVHWLIFFFFFPLGFYRLLISTFGGIKFTVKIPFPSQTYPKTEPRRGTVGCSVG